MGFQTLKKVFTMPEESKKSIYEEFDPVLITTECIESMMYKMFDDILDYEGDDAGFIAMFKKNNAALIVKIISEIEEGFMEGFNDVLVFLRVSCGNLLMASAPPAQAATAKGIAIPCIMKFIEKSWNERNGAPPPAPAKPAQAPVAKPQTVYIVMEQEFRLKDLRPKNWNKWPEESYFKSITKF